MAEPVKKKKIAIYIPDSKWLVPQIGGTFSVTLSLIYELDKRQDLGNFLVLLVDNTEEANLLRKYILNLEIVSINFVAEKKNYARRSIRQKIKKTIQNFLFGLITPRLPKVESKPTYVRSNPSLDMHLKKLLDDHKISLIYYPVQHKCLTTKFPFIATNWDVAHRSTYYFPEIEKMYDLREDWYSNILPRAVSVFCESEAGKKELVKYYQLAENKIKVHPLVAGPVVDLNVPETRQNGILNSYGLDKNGFFFYPAQFWALKNHKTLVDAFIIFRKAHTDKVKLVFTGTDKGNLNYIREYCLSNNLNSVVMLGFVDDETLHTLYKNALAMIMPTLLGPTNMPVLEAMALGCPVFCSDLDGHYEITQNKEQLFSPLNCHELSNLMSRCYSEESYRNDILKKQYAVYNSSKFNKNLTADSLINNISAVMKIRDLWN